MMQKTYLSRAMTRAMALDHPIGDPTGGAAYGEKNDPVSAIVSIGSMAGTYAAAGSFAAMTLTQGLVFAGAAVSLVGNVTGNKTLSKIGMVTGLAGGVGMLAEWATGSTLGGTVGDTFGFGGEAAGADAALVATPASGPQTPVVDGVPTAPAVEAMNVGPLEPAASLNTPGGAASPTTPAMINTANNSVDPIGSLLQQKGATVGPYGDSIRQMTPVESLWQKTKDFGSGIMDMTKTNPGMAMVMGNAASGVADWLSGKSDAEIAALEAQTGFADAKAMQIQEEIANERRRRANINSGYTQVNTSMQVNPNASIPMPWQVNPNQQYVPQPNNPGLIQGALMPRA